MKYIDLELKKRPEICKTIFQMCTELESKWMDHSLNSFVAEKMKNITKRPQIYFCRVSVFDPPLYALHYFIKLWSTISCNISYIWSQEDEKILQLTQTKQNS